MLDEQRVERDPVPRVDRLAQPPLRLLGGAGAHDAEAVGDPMHVRVDGDRRLAVGEDQDAVGGLRAHTRQREELLARARDLSAMPLEERLGARPEDAAFRPVEPHRPDQPLDVCASGPGEAPRVRVPGEQPRRGDVRRLVARPLREDRPDQHLEGALGVVAQVRPTPVAGPVERGQPVQQELPVERGLRRHGVPAPGGRRGGRSIAGPCPGSLRSGSSDAPGPRSSSPTR